jgi:hypothetical protein
MLDKFLTGENVKVNGRWHILSTCLHLDLLKVNSQSFDHYISLSISPCIFLSSFVLITVAYNVPHHRLITKLKDYGISGNIIEWIKNFLLERKQKVVLNGSNSKWTDSKSKEIIVRRTQ